MTDQSDTQLELLLYPPETEMLKLDIAKETLDSLVQVASRQNLSTEELVRCYIGRGLKQDMALPLQERLKSLLASDLDFHGQDTAYASHNFHSFPAKFPPQLPNKFIANLTEPGDTVLDPMMGSGTTVLEAFLSGRYSIGFDIDPMALMITKVKVTALDREQLQQVGKTVLTQAKFALENKRHELKNQLENKWDVNTRKFINYWFAQSTQLELLALINEIEQVEENPIKAFLELTFSAIIITKSGGVSLALDLAHTRPHRAKIVASKAGEIILGQNLLDDPNPRLKVLTKTLRSPLKEFEKRFQKNISNLPQNRFEGIQPLLQHGDAQKLPLYDNTVDLIVTSPPYAANAIDYMRAHKFSLAWLGYPIDELGQKRRRYIGGESLTEMLFEELPDYTTKIVSKLAKVDEKKGAILHRYYSEMTRTLREIFRVLKPGKVAIVVVGNSTMRSIDTQTGNCLADIGRKVGFEVPKIGVRQLDRNKRMLPASAKVNLKSQIQQRMHEEYVIGLIKP